MADPWQGSKEVQQAWAALIRPETTIHIDLDRVTYLAASVAEDTAVTIRNKITGEYIYEGEEPFEIDDPFAGMFDDADGKVTRMRKVKFRNKTKFYGAGKKIQNRLAFINAERELQGEEPFTKDDFEITPTYEPKDIKYLYIALDGMINSILDFFGKTHFFGYLGHGSRLNRYEIESLVRYKEERKYTRRPCLLKEAHEYVIKKYKPMLVSEIEVDDMMTRIQFAGHQHFKKHGWYDRVSVCTDKDSHQTAGLMFDWIKPFGSSSFKYPMPRQIPNELGFLEKQVKVSGKNKTTKIFGLGRKMLYKQLITGDTTDTFSPTNYWKDTFHDRQLTHNVDQSLLKNGDIKAYNALADCETDEECWRAICQIYQEWFPGVIEYVSWKGNKVKTNWLGVLQQVADAAFMQRVPNDKLDVTKVLDRYGIEYDWVYEVTEMEKAA